MENENIQFSASEKILNRPVTGGGGVVCICWDIRSVNYFCFLKISTLQLGMVEHLKVRENCHKIENNDFQLCGNFAALADASPSLAVKWRSLRKQK